MVQKIEKMIDISPHRSIMTKISQTGYSIQEALSELIDNAIDARVDGKKLVVDMEIKPDKIIITDDGVGMHEDQAMKCIRLGFSEKKKKLGEFGLGLKTATSFLGKSFTLTTSPSGLDEEYQLQYDEDEWLENGDWHNYPFKVYQGVDKKKSGTKVIIEKLKVGFPEKLLKNIREEFGMRFGPFIKNEELELIFNNENCLPLELHLIDGNRNEFEFAFSGGKAWGWWSYQLAGFNKSYYGFHTFRRGRLVTTYDKIGLTPNQDIKQIIGDLHIEGIPITHDKKGWLQSSEEFQELASKMREYFKPFEKKPKKILSGYPVSGGKIVGTIRQINMFMSGDMETEMSKIKNRDIIVTAMTRPHFLLGIRRSGGIITDLGGTLCHAAIVAREFNIPAVVGTQIATKTLRDGQSVILDGDTGIIYEN